MALRPRQGLRVDSAWTYVERAAPPKFVTPMIPARPPGSAVPQTLLRPRRVLGAKVFIDLAARCSATLGQRRSKAAAPGRLLALHGRRQRIRPRMTAPDTSSRSSWPATPILCVLPAAPASTFNTRRLYRDGDHATSPILCTPRTPFCQPYRRTASYRDLHLAVITTPQRGSIKTNSCNE